MTEWSEINVTALDAVDGVESGDTLLLIRSKADGTREAKRITASLFAGEDAYEIAQQKGYGGTYGDWQQLVEDIVAAEGSLAKVEDINLSLDSATGELVISVGK